jgi:hypothetical protein
MIETGNERQRPAETQMGVILASAICDQSLRRNELAEKEDITPNIARSHNGVGIKILTGRHRPHAKYVAATNS